jgi:hypothetical protein
MTKLEMDKIGTSAIKYEEIVTSLHKDVITFEKLYFKIFDEKKSLKIKNESK